MQSKYITFVALGDEDQMLQSEYLELAIELYDIYLANDKHP